MNRYIGAAAWFLDEDRQRKLDCAASSQKGAIRLRYDLARKDSA
jgi:hypothetical protein